MLACPRQIGTTFGSGVPPGWPEPVLVHQTVDYCTCRVQPDTARLGVVPNAENFWFGRASRVARAGSCTPNCGLLYELCTHSVRVSNLYPPPSRFSLPLRKSSMFIGSNES